LKLTLSVSIIHDDGGENFINVYDSIINVESDIENAEEQIAYTNKFLKPYLDSEYADYFLAHKNNILFYGEYIVRFQAAKEIILDYELSEDGPVLNFNKFISIKSNF